MLVCEVFLRSDPYPNMGAVQVSVLVSRGELVHPLPPNLPPLLKEVLPRVSIPILPVVLVIPSLRYCLVP